MQLHTTTHTHEMWLCVLKATVQTIASQTITSLFVKLTVLKNCSNHCYFYRKLSTIHRFQVAFISHWDVEKKKHTQGGTSILLCVVILKLGLKNSHPNQSGACENTNPYHWPSWIHTQNTDLCLTMCEIA